MQIIERVKQLIEPIAGERNYCIVDITYKSEGGKPALRIIADKEGGITMGECAALNNKLRELLDKENGINEEYLLEVSSPGLDRKLKKDTDFVWAVGKKVKITTYMPIEGSNTFSGNLVGLGEGAVVIEKDGIATQIPRDKIASAKVDANIDWSQE